MTTVPVTVPPALLLGVQAVLAAAIDRMQVVGWSKRCPNYSHDGARLVDALNYGSAIAGAQPDVHRLVFACAAMAIEPHANIGAHELLPEPLADRYLDPAADEQQLHRLDASIITRYNSEVCGGYEDALGLLHVAYGCAEQVITMHIAYRAGAL